MATYSKPAAAGASLHPMLNIAVKAARAAGGIINRASLDLDSVRVARKAANDMVSEVDEAAEKVIIETLLEAYPRHAVLAEESGAHLPVFAAPSQLKPFITSDLIEGPFQHS